MNKFTPGPWRIENSDVVFGMFVLDNVYERSIEEERKIDQVKEEEANIRLISNAPEMYELLKKLRTVISIYEDDYDPAHEKSDIINKLLKEIDGE